MHRWEINSASRRFVVFTCWPIRRITIVAWMAHLRKKRIEMDRSYRIKAVALIAKGTILPPAKNPRRPWATMTSKQHLWGLKCSSPPSTKIKSSNSSRHRCFTLVSFRCQHKSPLIMQVLTIYASQCRKRTNHALVRQRISCNQGKK